MTNAQQVPQESLDVVIGANVHRLQWRARMSQTQLALTLGMTQGALSRKLRGDRPWYAEEIKGAADTFTVSVGSLFEKLPDLDSNQEPAGFVTAPISLDSRRLARESSSSRITLGKSHNAVVTALPFAS